MRYNLKIEVKAKPLNFKKIAQTRRQRGYNWEDTLVKRFNSMDNWKAFRLGSPSVALPDVLCVNNEDSVIFTIEAKQIDVAEVHDAFSVCELMAISELGLTSNEKSGEFVRDLFNTENRMINPRGGLIGAGHPLGATGISQTIEITNQLQGKSDKRQISNAKIGLIHNMSAAGTSSSIMVLKN